MTTEKKKNGRPKELKCKVPRNIILDKVHNDWVDKMATSMKSNSASAYIRKLIEEDMAKNG